MGTARHRDRDRSERSRELVSLLRSGSEISEVALHIGCSPELIRRWIAQVGRRDSATVQGLGGKKHAELRRLRRENRRLRGERDRLLSVSARGGIGTGSRTRLVGGDSDTTRTASAPDDDLTVWLRGLA